MVVLNLLEDGYLQKLKKKWWYDKGECPVEDGTVGRSFMLRLSNSPMHCNLLSVTGGCWGKEHF